MGCNIIITAWIGEIMNDRDTIKTYIIETSTYEYYCGKTKDIDKRMKEHRSEKYPHWFCNNERRNFVVKVIIIGDYEKEIKRFGVKEFLTLLANNNLLGVSLS